MQEKIITGRKYGMAVLLGYLALLAAAVLAIIYGAVRGHVFFVVLGVLYVSLGWIALCGLRILKPQEALVLTLFGKYIGTLLGGQPRGEHKAQPERRRGRRQKRYRDRCRTDERLDRSRRE